MMKKSNQFISRLILAFVVVPLCVSCTDNNSAKQKSSANSANKTEPNEKTTALGVAPNGAIVDGGPMPIEPTGEVVTADTVLNVGDRVQVFWNGPFIGRDGKTVTESWWNGEVVDCNKDGTVKIHYSGWRSEWDESVRRNRLRKE